MPWLLCTKHGNGGRVGAPRGRNTHSTQAWVEALGEGAKGILAAIGV